jgi:hypothetical protein
MAAVKWIVWSALFAIGVFNGLIMSRLYAAQRLVQLTPPPPPPPPLPSMPGSSSSSSLSPRVLAMESDDGVGRPARGSLSDWCYALRPDIYPHENLLVDPNELAKAPSSCAQYVALGHLPPETSLGDRIVAWMGAAAVSLVWGMPLAVSGPSPMGSGAAEEIVGLTRGLPRTDRLGLTTVNVSIQGSTLEDIADEVPNATACNTVFQLDRGTVHLNDLTVSRWAFADRIGTSFRRLWMIGKGDVRYNPATVAVAVHLTRSRRAASSAVEISWLQNVVWQILRLANTGMFNANERWPGQSAPKVVFSEKSHAPVHVYVFAESVGGAQWIL